MIFTEGHLYHIYNQGNNKRNIFFEKDNYLFFIQKMKSFIHPYADILAWCLMPNHFHWMVLVRNVELMVASKGLAPSGKSQGLTQSQALTGSGYQSQALTGQGQSQALTKPRSFNDSIGILLRSYTRAINKQEGFTGTLFRKETKAECINCPNGITPAFVSGSGTTHITYRPAEQQYPQLCFNYIHQNPVTARLVKDAVDWEFSSARDYAGLRDGKLVNKEVAEEYVKVN